MREQQNNKRDRTTIGLDLGDQWHRFCVLRISKRGDIYLQRLLVSSETTSSATPWSTPFAKRTKRWRFIFPKDRRHQTKRCEASGFLFCSNLSARSKRAVCRRSHSV